MSRTKNVWWKLDLTQGDTCYGNALSPRIIIPMHFSDQGLLGQFLNLIAVHRHSVCMHPTRTIRFTKCALARCLVIVPQCSCN